MEMEFWISILIILIVLEAITYGLVSIWYILSALLVILLKFIGLNNPSLEITIFIIFGTVLLIFTRKILKEKLMPKNIKTNLDRVVGMKGKVIEEIKANELGVVKVDGKRWSAYSNKDILKDKDIKVIKMDGNKLIVEED